MALRRCWLCYGVGNGLCDVHKDQVRQRAVNNNISEAEAAHQVNDILVDRMNAAVADAINDGDIDENSGYAEIVAVLADRGSLTRFEAERAAEDLGRVPEGRR